MRACRAFTAYYKCVAIAAGAGCAAYLNAGALHTRIRQQDQARWKARFDVEELARLAEERLQRMPWLPRGLLSFYRQRVQHVSDGNSEDLEFTADTCDACEQPVFYLQKCTACGVQRFCCTACIRQHWRPGSRVRRQCHEFRRQH